MCMGGWWEGVYIAITMISQVSFFPDAWKKTHVQCIFVQKADNTCRTSHKLFQHKNSNDHIWRKEKMNDKESVNITNKIVSQFTLA